MIKYFIRRTSLKEYNKESQDRLLQLNSRNYIIQMLCFAFWEVSCMCVCIPPCIISVYADIKLPTQIAITAFEGICFIVLLVSRRLFGRRMSDFTIILAKRIYFLVCTIKGKAFGKKEIKFIKQVNEKLYKLIITQMCVGYCYSICFEMCKILKKGSIEFIALKNFSTHYEEDEDGKNFTIHVLYVNNGWAFDTFSCRQYPIEKLYEIYIAKVYKSFTFNEISGKSYEEFKAEQESKLAKWCSDNHCSMFLKDNKENT